MADVPEIVRDRLTEVWGYPSLRHGQDEIIASILSGHDTLAIMPTGGGKSICFQLPALFADGLTLVISPLISLMHDQVYKLKERGVAAGWLDSTLTTGQQNTVMKRAVDGAYKILYVSPERLQTDRFLNAVGGMRIGFLVVDEAHCVSKWGTAFRPEYKQIAAFVRRLPARPIIAAFTATANPETRKDIVDSLKLNNPQMFVAGFDRENLILLTKKFKNKGERTKAVVDEVVKRAGQCGIVYCITRKDVESTAAELLKQGVNCCTYHAGLSDDRKNEALDLFLSNKIDVVVATSAFGMGIDKPNVRFVINAGMRDSVEDYYQNAGRAGRDGQKSDCVLFWTQGDIQLWKWIFQKGLEDGDLTPPEERAQLRHLKAELNHMIDYCETKQCLHYFIMRHFGERTQKHGCKSCSNCLAPKPKNKPTAGKKWTSKTSAQQTPVKSRLKTAGYVSPSDQEKIDEKHRRFLERRARRSQK